MSEKHNRKLARMSWGELRHNSCTRCRGTMTMDRDRFGTFLQCLQCGHVMDLRTLLLRTDEELLTKMKKRAGTNLAKPDPDSVAAG